MDKLLLLIELILRNKLTVTQKINLLNTLDIAELLKLDDENQTFKNFAKVRQLPE